MIADAAVERQRRLLRAAQVGDDDARALGGEPVGDRAADALRRARDDGDLAVERAHQRIGREGGRDEDAVLLGVDQRLDLREERLPRVVGLQLRAALLALGEVLVAPHARVRRERADVGREDAEQVAEVALLELDALGLVELHELVQLAGDHVVVALLDDHCDAADAEVLDLEPLLDAVLRALAADARLLDAAERHDLGGDEPGVDAVDAVLERLREPPDARRCRACSSTRRARTACRSRRGPPRSSVVKRAMPATGPNVSSHDIAASAVTPVITVGCQKRPPRPSPPSSSSPPRSTASPTWRCTLSIADCSISGPTFVSGSSPLPTLSFEAASTSRETNVVVDPVLHEDPVRRDARLAAVPELADQRAGDGRVEVGVVEDDERGVAAELERDLLHLLRALRHQELPDLGRAGEAELADDAGCRSARRRSSARPRRRR